MKQHALLDGILLLLICALPASAQTSVITEWPLPVANSNPISITVDPQGMVYFVENPPFRKAIARLDPQANQLTEWLDTSPGGVSLSRMFVATDGQIFFAGSGAASSVHRFDPGTSVLTRWRPSPSFDVNNLALDATDPENPSVWLIGLGPTLPRLNPANNEFQNFSLSPLGLGTGIFAEVDSEGKVWTTWQRSVLVRLDPATGERTAYADCQIGPGCTPGQQALTGGALGIRVNDDGQVVVTEPTANQIGLLDPEVNVITEYAVPTADSRPWDLDTGFDIFFTERAGNKVTHLAPSFAVGTDTQLLTDTATITPSVRPQAPFFSSLSAVDSPTTPSVTQVDGNVDNGFVEFAVPTGMSSPNGIAVAGCSVFFTETTGNKIGRLEIPPDEPMRRLKEKAARLADASALNPTQADSLLARLEEARYFFSFQNAGGAKVALRGFITEVGDLMQAGILSPSQGRSLLTAAEKIRHFCN